MVKGLDRFKAHFESFGDRYILIGGTACFLSMNDVGLDFRATKDLDIVLCVEALDSDFVNAFWDFVRLGKYKNQQKSTGRKIFYRFDDPGDDTFPVMLELFSRIPDALRLRDDSHLTPIPMDEAASSLSAILLDEGYYHFIQTGKRMIDGLSVIGPECLIPLKAKAWLDMVERRENGARVDSGDIRKHRNDVFRLFQIVPREITLNFPDAVFRDLSSFVEAMIVEDSINLKALGIRNATLEEVLDQIRAIYRLGRK